MNAARPVDGALCVAGEAPQQTSSDARPAAAAQPLQQALGQRFQRFARA